MSGSFTIYLQLGFEHITDISGYDHILFLIALCAVYRPADWRRVLLLVTAFTVGHSVTLALAALNVVGLAQPLIEFLVPVTILLTALYQAITFREKQQQRRAGPERPAWISYLLALFFGLIHGMAFSNFFRASLFPGQEGELVRQLLAFNLGVELGQLVIVVLVLALAALIVGAFKVRQREWCLFVAGAAFGPALVMAVERW